ncbi:MAG: RNA methyltransferase [Promethearchaeota archaeon]
MNKKKYFKELNSYQETHVNEKYKNLSFTVILVQPETAGNIGSIARIMKNFGFNELVIFNPIDSVEKILSYETQGFAMRGKDILLNAKIVTNDEQKDYLNQYKSLVRNYDLIIATTAKGKHYRNIKRLAIFPEDLTIPISEKPLNIAILFGKESSGLTNEEISLADILLRIPSNDDYPTLNISHACAIILYEIFKKIYFINIGRGKSPVLLATKDDRLFLRGIIKGLIEKLKIRTYKEENVFFAFKNIFERALMSKKELNLITGLFSKLNLILKDIDLYEN